MIPHLQCEQDIHARYAPWSRAVFRPTEGSGSAGALAATQKHLDDMRKIAFKELNIE